MSKKILLSVTLAMSSFAPTIFAEEPKQPVNPEQNTQTAETEENQDELSGDVIVIKASFSQIAAPQKITSEDIKGTSIGNGNVTDLLKTSPSVLFSNSSDSGLTQGEIKPSTISIHGSTGYQNNYMLDGISFNNDIDPSDPGLGSTSTRLSSSEQGFYLDSRLIDEIKVYDKNIPVEYGGFTGGVVDITGRRWRNQNGGSIFYSTTHSSWNKTHVDPRIDFDTSHNDVSHPSRYQPNYKKNNFGGWFEAGITDTLGFVFSGSHRESDISSISYQGNAVGLDGNNKLTPIANQGGFKDQTRRADNFSTKFSWYATENTNLDLAINYANHEDYSFASNMANSGYTTKHKALGAMLQLTHHWDVASLDVTAGYQQLEDDRDNDQNYMIIFTDYTNWQNPKDYNSGGVGNLTTKQNNINLKTKLAFNPTQWLHMTHNPTVGMEFSQVKARYIRNSDYYQYRFNGTWDSMPWIEYADNGSVFEAGTHSATYNSYTLFVDDTVTYKQLTIRPGVRVDYDNFVEKFNIAPRLTIDYDLFGDGNTKLSTGANRYYGRNIMVYALYGAQNAGLKNCYFCKPGDADNEWTSSTDFEGLDSLETPYNDEFTLSVEQAIMNSLWKVQYVHRESYDEVISRPKYVSGSSVRTFDNSGRSSNDSLALSVQNRNPWQLMTTEHTLSASIIWEKSNSNTPKNGYANYDPAGNISRDKVWYNGSVINASDLPATDFNLPLRINLELKSAFPDYDLAFYNLLQWHSQRYQAVRFDNEYHEENGERMAKYNREDFASTFRWDVKALWTPSFLPGANFSVEVNNILNKRNITDRYIYSTSKGDTGTVLNSYEPGRQIWLQVGYDF